MIGPGSDKNKVVPTCPITATFEMLQNFPPQELRYRYHLLVNDSVLRQIKEMDIESYSVVQIKKPTTTAAVGLKMCVRDYKAIWSLFRRSSYPTNLASVSYRWYW